MRVRVGSDNSSLYPLLCNAVTHTVEPTHFEIVEHDDVYPTIWSYWSAAEYTVIGYMRDGSIVKGISPRKVNEIKGLR